MPSYSKSSNDKLFTCDARLQKIFSRIIVWYDNTVLVGHRGREDQEKAVAEGRSKVHYPNSHHNSSPSRAADVAPYLGGGRGIPWPKTPAFLSQLSKEERAELNTYVKATAQFYHFAGVVEATAHEMGVSTRWGGDWDRDHCFSDQTFDDLVHFELYDG